MLLYITDEERELLYDLLETVCSQKIHELHHTDSHSYKQLVKQQLALFEGIQAKLKDEAVESKSAAH
jgi:hypothetical protein